MAGSEEAAMAARIAALEGALATALDGWSERAPWSHAAYRGDPDDDDREHTEYMICRAVLADGGSRR